MPLTAVSVGSMEPVEETVPGLKRKLEDMEKEHNELKRKLGALEAESLQSKTQTKALTYKLQKVEEENKKLVAENESLRVTKRHMIGIPSGQCRPKRNVKATRALVQDLDEQYVGIGLHIESLLSSWAVK